MQPEDRAYLVRLTAAHTGLAPPDAERRVDEVAARAKENITRARRSAVILPERLRCSGPLPRAPVGACATAKRRRTRFWIGEDPCGEPEVRALRRRPVALPKALRRGTA
jgi:hypothetical protein